MKKIIRFTIKDLSKITDYRNGEIKFGERIQTVPIDKDLTDFLSITDAKFVLFGIFEDIGIRANFGKSKTSTIWKETLKNIANIQNNKFCKGSHLLILGQVNVNEEIKQSKTLDCNDKEERKKLSELVENIDKEVSHIVFTIIKAGKIPIVIGKGHNNAYGNIKGTALAKGKPINAINFDTHSGFKILEGRHSGNSFSYAYEEGFLKKYFIFGLHENFISKAVLDNIKKTEGKVRYNTYDEIAVRREKNFYQEMFQVFDFIKNENFGIEINLNAIQNIGHNRITLDGFSVKKLRQFIHHFGQNHRVSYLHICEGISISECYENSPLTGKLIVSLITDFMKINNNSAV